MFCIDEVTTDFHMELLLSALRESAGSCQLQNLKIDVGSTYVYLQKSGYESLKRLLQFHLPEDCTVDFLATYGIREWSIEMPWVISQAVSLMTELFNWDDLETY